MASASGRSRRADLDAAIIAATGRSLRAMTAALDRGGTRFALQLIAALYRQFRRGMAAERRRIAAAVAASPGRKAARVRLANRIYVGGFAGAEFGQRRTICIRCRRAPLPAIPPDDGLCLTCRRADLT